VPPALRDRVFAGNWAIHCGLLTPANLRSAAWRRLFHGVYADASLTVTHRLLCRAACEFVLPPGSVLAGGSAAHLLGVPAGPEAPVEAYVPAGRRPRRTLGLRPRLGALPADEVMVVDRLRVTTPVRTCWDLVRWTGLVDGIVATDRLLATGRLFRGDLEKYRDARATERCGRRFATAVALVDGAAESPPESELRVRLVLAGLPRPEVQYRVFADHRFVARVDLAWPDAKVAVEYDGAWHGGPGQLHADRRRLNRLVGAGWVVLHVTSVRMRADLDGVVAEISAALARRNRG
jgi:hypothetical protein